MLGTYTGIVTEEFIKRRDYMVSQPNWNAGIRGADAEFPEWHQALIDPNQTLHEGWEWDTNHLLYETLDYKQFAKPGVKISPAIKKMIEQGRTKNLPIWRWSNGNLWVELKEGMEVSYDIIGVVNARQALYRLKNVRNPKTNKMEKRFTFDEKHCIINSYTHQRIK
jgi:hypothetical protein